MGVGGHPNQPTRVYHHVALPVPPGDEVTHLARGGAQRVRARETHQRKWDRHYLASIRNSGQRRDKGQGLPGRPRVSAVTERLCCIARRRRQLEVALTELC